MDIEDMDWYRQWTSKMFGQWTLMNILNIDDAHIRISIIVPDTNLDTYPEFLFDSVPKFLFLTVIAVVQVLN